MSSRPSRSPSVSRCLPFRRTKPLRLYLRMVVPSISVVFRFSFCRFAARNRCGCNLGRSSRPFRSLSVSRRLPRRREKPLILYYTILYYTIIQYHSMIYTCIYVCVYIYIYIYTHTIVYCLPCLLFSAA